MATKKSAKAATATSVTRSAVKKTPIKDLSSTPKSGAVKGGGRGQPVSG